MTMLRFFLLKWTNKPVLTILQNVLSTLSEEPTKGATTMNRRSFLAGSMLSITAAGVRAGRLVELDPHAAQRTDG